MNRLQIVTIDAYKVLKRLTPNVNITSENVFKIVQEHGLCGVVDLSLLPENARRKCHEYARQVTVSNRLHWEAASRIAEAFYEEGIPVLFLKGIALAHSLYSPGMRPYTDIDIWIPRDQVHTAHATLISQGYQVESSFSSMVALPQWLYRQKLAGVPIRVDLHVQSSNRPALRQRMPFTDSWQNRQTLSARRHVMGLSMADNILYACLHRSGHHGHEDDKGIWLLDIHRLWQSATVKERQSCVAAARKEGLGAILYNGIEAAEIFGELPEKSLRNSLLADGATNRIIHRLLRHHSWFGRRYVDLCALTWAERRQFVHQYLFPPRHYMQKRYHCGEGVLSLWWAYLKRLVGAAPSR